MWMHNPTTGTSERVQQTEWCQATRRHSNVVWLKYTEPLGSLKQINFINLSYFLWLIRGVHESCCASNSADFCFSSLCSLYFWTCTCEGNWRASPMTHGAILCTVDTVWFNVLLYYVHGKILTKSHNCLTIWRSGKVAWRWKAVTVIITWRLLLFILFLKHFIIFITLPT